MFELDENIIRLSLFIGTLILCLLLEALFPKKQRSQQRLKRWLTNISLVVIDSIAIRLMGPVTAISVAALANSKGWGLFNLSDLPFWLEIITAFVLLDLAIYIQHVLSHQIPIFWRFHRVHHADRDIDATTGTRFHPIEIMLSMLYKAVIILLLGPAIFAVLLFETVLSTSAIFNHSNLKLPHYLDSLLRMVIVTPDMHRVHHSIIAKETNSNYAFFLSIWDRLFHTYIAQPSKGHEDMIIGLEEYQDTKPSDMTWCLKLPFTR